MGGVNRRKHRRRLGWGTVCFVTYFNVCGGPFGSEEIVSSAGPLPGLAGMASLLVLWAMPLAMVTAELSSAFPDDGGYSIWVAEAFGPFWGFQEAYWSWVSGVIDTAVYPVLAYDTAVHVMSGRWSEPLDSDPEVLAYCNVSFSDSPAGVLSDFPSDLPPDPSSSSFPSLSSPSSLSSSTASPTKNAFEPSRLEAYAMKLLLALLFTLPNVCGTSSFGRGMAVLAVLVVAPFVVHMLYLPFHHEMHFGNLLEWDEDASVGDWAELVSVLYWNLSGFDSASTCAGEVRDPGRAYPKGLAAAVALVFVTYALPLSLLATVELPSWRCWDEGWFSVIAYQQVGSWLSLWVVLASVAGNAGMYTAEVFEDSWQLCGMARAGLAPAVFGRRYKGEGVPYVAVGLALAVVAGLIALDFNAIVAITNVFSCLSAMLELSSFLKLRMVQPELRRPFRLPVERMSLLAALMLVPFCLGVAIIASSVYTSRASALVNLFALVAGFALHRYMQSKGHIQYAYANGGMRR